MKAFCSSYGEAVVKTFINALIRDSVFFSDFQFFVLSKIPFTMLRISAGLFAFRAFSITCSCSSSFNAANASMDSGFNAIVRLSPKGRGSFFITLMPFAFFGFSFLSLFLSLLVCLPLFG